MHCDVLGCFVGTDRSQKGLLPLMHWWCFDAACTVMCAVLVSYVKIATFLATVLVSVCL
jgi:hypothetical protein